MSTLRVNTIQDASGGDIVNSRGIAKAWVNFNGTGTVAIRASLNVSSITDNGTGNFSVNFATALSDANYATNITLDGGNAYVGTVGNQTGSSVQVYGWTTGSSFFDNTRVAVTVFR